MLPCENNFRFFIFCCCCYFCCTSIHVSTLIFHGKNMPFSIWHFSMNAYTLIHLIFGKVVSKFKSQTKAKTNWIKERREKKKKKKRNIMWNGSKTNMSCVSCAMCAAHCIYMCVCMCMLLWYSQNWKFQWLNDCMKSLVFLLNIEKEEEKKWKTRKSKCIVPYFR